MSWISKRFWGNRALDDVVAENKAIIDHSHRSELALVRRDRDHWMQRFQEVRLLLENLGGEDLPYWKARAGQYAALANVAQEKIWDLAPDLLELRQHRVNALVSGITQAALWQHAYILEEQVKRLVTAIRTGGTI